MGEDLVKNGEKVALHNTFSLCRDHNENRNLSSVKKCVAVLAVNKIFVILWSCGSHTNCITVFQRITMFLLALTRELYAVGESLICWRSACVTERPHGAVKAVFCLFWSVPLPQGAGSLFSEHSSPPGIFLLLMVMTETLSLFWSFSMHLMESRSISLCIYSYD